MGGNGEYPAACRDAGSLSAAAEPGLNPVGFPMEENGVPERMT
jgi:hypothetical protein